MLQVRAKVLGHPMEVIVSVIGIRDTQIVSGISGSWADAGLRPRVAKIKPKITAVNNFLITLLLISLE